MFQSEMMNRTLNHTYWTTAYPPLWCLTQSLHHACVCTYTEKTGDHPRLVSAARHDKWLLLPMVTIRRLGVRLVWMWEVLGVGENLFASMFGMITNKQTKEWGGGKAPWDSKSQWKEILARAQSCHKDILSPTLRWHTELATHHKGLAGEPVIIISQHHDTDAFALTLSCFLLRVFFHLSLGLGIWSLCVSVCVSVCVCAA